MYVGLHFLIMCILISQHKNVYIYNCSQKSTRFIV